MRFTCVCVWDLKKKKIDCIIEILLTVFPPPLPCVYLLSPSKNPKIALKDAEHSLQKASDDELRKIPIYHNLGLIYHNLGEYSKALYYLEKGKKKKNKVFGCGCCGVQLCESKK